MKPGSKIYHVPVRLTAETVESAVNLHAGILIVVERTDRHAVFSYPDSVTLRSLPGSDRLLHSFKYIQSVPPEKEKAPVCGKLHKTSAV